MSKNYSWGLEFFFFFLTEKEFPSYRPLREPAENVSGPSSTNLCHSKLRNTGQVTQISLFRAGSEISAGWSPGGQPAETFSLGS